MLFSTMRRKLGVVFLTLSLSAPCFGVAAQPSVDSLPGPVAAATAERLRAIVNRNTKGKVVIDAVYPSPVSGVFEAVSGDDVFYVDASGRYGFVDGRLVDLEQSFDVTSLRIDRINRIDFSKLPLELAIKEVRGNGSRKLAVFEDPLCPICKSMTTFLGQIPDATLYRFPYPVIDPKASVALARTAWCAPDRRAAWAGAMRGEKPQPAPACDFSDLGRILKLGEALGVHETPTVFLGDGRRLKGAVPPEEFMKAVDASNR